jgi:hypothetical protein
VTGSCAAFAATLTAIWALLNGGLQFGRGLLLNKTRAFNRSCTDVQHVRGLLRRNSANLRISPRPPR